MMSPIIYSDLKFTRTAPPGANHRDSTLEDPTDDGDIMYENVIGPQPVREKRPPPAPPAPAMGRGRQLMAGLRKCSLHLSLVFLLLCLVLSAAVIGLTMKYVQKSSEFQTLVTDHQTMSSSMTQSLGSRDDLLKSLRIDLATTKTELEKTRLQLRKMEQNNRDLNSRLKSKEGLLESANKDLTATENDLEKNRSDLEKASRSNTDLKKDLQECRDGQKSSAEEKTNYLSKLEKCKQDNR
ncbi:PREDICTED: uncharacterized protein LOC108801986, partial [Nanorana parkeri]|uniref:uncharacterized protein LOC108801986 n=1 Tax=Nanorana parkeri TaxID=125878 RepID=UPI000854F06D